MIDRTNPIQNNLNALEAVIEWFADPERVLFHAVSRIARALITPLLQLAAGILVKRLFGLNQEASIYAQSTQIARLRRYINSRTLSQSAMSSAFSILGTHYEAVSVRLAYAHKLRLILMRLTQIVYRAMGAKIGRRVG